MSHLTFHPSCSNPLLLPKISSGYRTDILRRIFYGTDISIGYETITFETYAEAKAAAVGAGFVGGEDFAGEANMGEPTVDSLKKAINALEDLIISVDHQMDEEGGISKDDLRDIVDDVSDRTGLWYT